MESKNKTPMDINDIIQGLFLIDDNNNHQPDNQFNNISDTVAQSDVLPIPQLSDNDSPLVFDSEECPEFDTIHEEPQNVVQVSLLDNDNYMKLAVQCCEIYDDIDKISHQTTNPEVLSFLDLEKSRIREALLLSGASLINGEEKFDFVRHTAVLSDTLLNGRTIDLTLEPGIMIDDRVMIKAKVKLIEFEKDHELHVE